MEKCLHIIKRKMARSIGLEFYCTLKPCPNGNIDNRRTSNSRCICEDCVKRDSKLLREYYWNNPDYHRGRARNWHHENRNQAIERMKGYKEKNREKEKERCREYYRSNREDQLKKTRDYRESNREYWKKHREENRPRYHANASRRRAAERNRFLPECSELTDFIVEEASELCCTREMMHGQPWHIDHAVPLLAKEASGLHVGWNLQVIPAHANLKKGNRMIYVDTLEWLRDYSSEAEKTTPTEA